MSEVASPSVEQQFNRIVQAITQRLHLLDRLPRVRINAWLKKLKEEATSNATWQRNRNCYARLLLEQLRAGCLEVPFNTMPPEGGLPTLPPYLTYRFISPPKQHTGSVYSGSLDGPDFCSSSAVLAGCGVAGLSRPRSAADVHSRRAASPSLQQLAHDGLHNSWRVGPAASPNRSGSPASPHTLALQQQHWQDGSPRSVRTAGSFRRGYSNSAGNSPQHQQQRPRSPGAVGLVDAAAAVAAELEAEREEAARMSNRLRFAEDKILQQEAELVHLQGAASSARRRIKSATSATLTELLDRYGSAAAAWGGSSTAGLDHPGSAPAGLADGVYKPVWQLLSGLQSVLDSCDKEEQDWLRAKGAAAAAALQAAYESQGSPSTAAAEAGMSQWEGSGRDHGPQQQVQKGLGQFASEAAAAAAAEGAVLQHCEQGLQDLQQHAEQLVADMHRTKEDATAAAGGRGPLGAAAVAEGAAKLLRPMLKALRHEAKDASKLRKRLEMAAEATDAAATAAYATAACAAESVLLLQAALLQEQEDDSTDSGSSSSEDGGSEASSMDSRSSRRSSRRHLEQQQQVLAVAEQQQQQQGARLQRLQSASQVLMELDKASAKLQLQLKDAQQRLHDMANAATAAAAVGGNGGIGGSSALLQHHDNGLIAAATAGIAASLSAGLRGFHSSAGNLARLIQSLRGGAAAAAAAAGAASDAGRGFSSGGSSQLLSHQQQQGGDLFHGGSRGGSAGGVSSSGSPGKLPLGRSPSSRLGDATLAGTWGEQAAAAGGGVGAVGSPGAGSSPLHTAGGVGGGGGGSAYDAAAHYLIGAAAAAGAAGHSPSGGLGMHGVAAGAGPVDISPRGLTTMTSMGSKAAFAQQLQGTGGPASSAIGTGSHGGGGAVSGDAAADAVHAQLAGLSRQASRLSLKATKIISSGGSDLGSSGGGGIPAAGGVADGSSGGLRVLTGSGSFGGSSLRQREYQSPLLSTSLTGGSPFAATRVLSSPRSASLTSPRTQPGSFGVVGAPSAVAGGAFTGVAGAAGAFSKAGAGAFTGSSTSSLLLGGGVGRSALLGGSISSSRPVGMGTASPVGLGAAAFTSPLLQGGKFGGLGGVGGGLGLGGSSSGLLRGGGAAGKLSLSPGSTSSIAAISSRLQAMGNGGR